MIEERMVHAVELKKEMYEFGRDIEKGSMNKQLGKVFAEKVTRYFDDKIKKQVNKCKWGIIRHVGVSWSVYQRSKPYTN